MKRVKIFSWFKGLFSPSKENWRVVLLCLIAATTFWVLNALNKRYTTKISYPIEFLVDDPENVVVVKELPSKVEIDVSGGGWNLLRKTFWFNVNPLTIPLSNPTQVKFISGISLVPLISDQLSELSLNYVITDTLKIDIEAKVSKTAFVQVDSQAISLSPSYRLVSSIAIQPDTVTFTGPSSLIGQLPDTVYLTLPDNIAAGFNEEVNVTVIASDLISYSPTAVNVQFDVAPFVRENHVVDVQPINFPADSSVMLIDNKVEVIYSVREENKEMVTEESFQIIANFKKMEKEDSTINATLGSAPDFIYDLKVNPKKLRVKKVQR